MSAGMLGLRFFPTRELVDGLKALTRPGTALASFAPDVEAIARTLAPPADAAQKAANQGRLRAARRKASVQGDTALAELLDRELQKA